MKRLIFLCFVACAALGCEVIAGYDGPPSAEEQGPFTPAACANLDEDPRNCGNCGASCRDDQECLGGACACRHGLSLCGDTCVDIESDPKNCGGCGKPCSAGSACASGRCRSSCNGALTACPAGDATACVRKTGPLDCGGCGVHCAVGELCIASSCRRYAPAGTCSTCPCEACSAGSKCCPPPIGHAAAICVGGDACP